MAVQGGRAYGRVLSCAVLLVLVTANLWRLRCRVCVQVAGKRWKVDLNSRQEASLLLSAVNLPGGVQVCTAPPPPAAAAC